MGSIIIVVGVVLQFIVQTSLRQRVDDLNPPEMDSSQSMHPLYKEDSSSSFNLLSVRKGHATDFHAV